MRATILIRSCPAFKGGKIFDPTHETRSLLTEKMICEFQKINRFQSRNAYVQARTEGQWIV